MDTGDEEGTKEGDSSSAPSLLYYTIKCIFLSCRCFPRELNNNHHYRQHWTENIAYLCKSIPRLNPWPRLGERFDANNCAGGKLNGAKGGNRIGLRSRAEECVSERVSEWVSIPSDAWCNSSVSRVEKCKIRTKSHICCENKSAWLQRMQRLSLFFFLLGLFGLALGQGRPVNQPTNQPPREQWWWNDDIRVEQRIKRKKGANCHLQRMNCRMALNFANISTITTTHGKRLLYRIIPFVKPDYRHPQRSVYLVYKFLSGFEWLWLWNVRERNVQKMAKEQLTLNKSILFFPSSSIFHVCQRVGLVAYLA